MSWYLKALRHYADFSGRARRTEYWMFRLVNILIFFSTGAVDALLGMQKSVGGEIGPVVLAYYLAVLVPSLAVGARRLHDTGRSGWWQLFGPIPVLDIALIFMLCGVSRTETNKWGQSPLHAQPAQGTLETSDQPHETTTEQR
jgi:uncharacterized membrane protein YhaH (DUF805 family)